MGSYTFFGWPRPWRKTTVGNSSESASSTAYDREDQNIAAPTSVNNVTCSYALSNAASEAKTETVAVADFEIRLTKNAVSVPIVPGSVAFDWNGKRFVDRLGTLFSDPDPNTGIGVERGTIDYLTGVVKIDVFDGGDNQLAVKSLAGRLGSQYVTEVTFRTPGAPLRPGSLTIAGVTMHGERISAVADFNGSIDESLMTGAVDYEKGVCTIGFGQLIDDSTAYVDEPWYNADLVTGDGKVWKPEPVYADSLEYACVVYSYIPLDAGLLGINPVRLPSDGRVVIVKPGDVVVIHNTDGQTLEGDPAGGVVYTLPRAADSVEVYDSADPPLRVPSSMYAHEAGGNTITIDAVNNDFSDFTLPLVAMHKIEDMILVSETQINGQISLSRGTAKAFPESGTLVSSALRFGDLQSRYYGLFDQKTWQNSFSDDLVGSPANATFNEIDYPVVVKNSGAVTERWALVFDGSDHFNIIGENRGIIGSGYITQDCQPINLATGKPYWFIDYRAFGSGWAAGNVIRFNTVGAAADCWGVRTTQQGDETEPADFFAIQPRGDAR